MACHGMEKKYHISRWEWLASLKKPRGLGFTNTKIMNKCLLAKWNFKTRMGLEKIIVVRKKYLGDKGTKGFIVKTIM